MSSLQNLCMVRIFFQPKLATQRAGERGQTHESFDAIQRLFGYVYREPSGPKKKGWRVRYLRGTRAKFPTPVSSKSISKFADQKCLESGLEEFPAELGGGAQFNPGTIVNELISTLATPPSYVPRGWL